MKRTHIFVLASIAMICGAQPTAAQAEPVIVVMKGQDSATLKDTFIIFQADSDMTSDSHSRVMWHKPIQLGCSNIIGASNWKTGESTGFKIGSVRFQYFEGWRQVRYVSLDDETSGKPEEGVLNVSTYSAERLDVFSACRMTLAKL